MPTSVFEPAVASANRWIQALVESLDLPAHSESLGLHALRAGLHAIRDRLPMNEVIDLGAQLPTVIRGLYYEGWSRRHDPTQIRTRTEMIARVRRGLGMEHRIDPVDVLRGVIELLVEHVTPGEIRDVVATLPRPIATLWQDLTGHAIDDLDEPPSAAW